MRIGRQSYDKSCQLSVNQKYIAEALWPLKKKKNKRTTVSTIINTENDNNDNDNSN